MFEAKVADALQLISLPLEALGFTLALIEIRFSRFAEYLRSRIQKTRADVSGSFLSSDRPGNRDRTPWAWAILSALVVLAGYWLYRVAVSLGPVAALVYFLGILVLIASPWVLGPLLRICMRKLLGFVSQFADGREIGVFGLMLASMGILAESYQLGELIAGDALPGPGVGAPIAILLAVGWLICAMGALMLLSATIAYRFPRFARLVERFGSGESD